MLLSDNTMRALVSAPNWPLDDVRSVAEVQLPIPLPGPQDLLVKVEAIAVNPRDYKQRALPQRPNEAIRLLGWDAAGVVTQVGSAVTLFKPGEAVYYAGTSARVGCNSEWHTVDERLVGPKPKTLSFVEAAAMPLVGLTAWECLSDRLGFGAPDVRPTQRSLLVIGGAGGVGTMAIQLAAKAWGMRVVASASRPDSIEWCTRMGASHVINHFGDMQSQALDLGIASFDAVLILNDIDRHFPTACDLVAAQGAICSIVEPRAALEMSLLRRKSARLCWELMFTRSVYETPDMVEQHRALACMADLVDQGVIRSPLRTALSPINAANLWQAYRSMEEGHAIGKTALVSW